MSWISAKKRPEEKLNPVTNDYYVYPVYAVFGNICDIRYYKYGDGHWRHGPQVMDQYVICWMDIRPPKDLDIYAYVKESHLKNHPPYSLENEEEETETPDEDDGDVLVFHRNNTTVEEAKQRLKEMFPYAKEEDFRLEIR